MYKTGCTLKSSCSRLQLNCLRYFSIAFLTIVFTLFETHGAISFTQRHIIDLDFKNAKLEKVMREIRNQGDYSFLFDADILESAPKVTVKVKSNSINEVLDQVLDQASLQYQVDGKIIKVFNTKTRNIITSNTSNKTSKNQELVRINGVVKDGDGIPLANVTIIEKENQKNGTSTDRNGTYSIDVNKGNSLIFRLVGYQPKEYLINQQIDLDVKLEIDPNEIEDIVVVGFGSQKKTDMIGSVSSIKPSDLKVPSSNLTTALAGRAAGVIAFQRSGEPGMDNADFFIRGVTTFGYKVDPLILIDNVEVTTTDLARLQVDDIEDFVIMKDATATAVYGARGANGVILITTKQGVEGKARISIRAENSISQPTKEVDLVDPVTYMEMHNESLLTRDPLSPLLYSQKKIDNTVVGSESLRYPSVDWKSELLKKYTMNQRLNLNISGGGSVARYFVSGAINQDNGILKVDNRSNFNNNINLKTYSLRSNVNIDLSSSTEFLVRLNGSFDDYTGPLSGGTKVYRDIMRTSPVLFAPYYPVSENYEHVNHIMFGNYGEGNYLNPYADMVKGYREYSRSMMLAQLELKQNLNFFTEGLSFRMLANTTRNSYFAVNRQYNPFYYELLDGRGDGPLTYYLINEDQGTEYLDYKEGRKDVSSVFYMESALNYSRTFNDKHTFSGMLVHILRNRLEGNAGSLQLSLPFRNVGLSGRMTYSYDKRYYAEFNFGYNGSERFYKSNRFGFFPSGGIAWTVSNEKFFSGLKDNITNLRIRGTYGVVGNDAIGSPSDRFFYLSNVNMNSDSHGYTFGENRGYSKDGIVITRYSNPDITWETAYKSNIALELELWNKLKLNVDAFYEHRKNILMTRADIPSTMGLSSSISANLGEAIGKGLDFSLDYSKSFSNGLWLQGMGNFTYATSEYKVYEEPMYFEPWLTRIGYPLSIRRGFIAERLFVDDEEVANSPEQHFGEVRGGDIKYMDINGDGQITDLDKVPLGYPTTPEINYGFGISAGKAGFDFSVFFQGLGRESFWINPQSSAPFRSYSYSGESFPSGTVLQNHVLQSFADSYWSEDNRDIYALWPRLSSEGGNENNEQVSTWFMRNGRFLRLKQLEIGYSLPDKICERIKANKLRIYLNGSNLLTFSKFKLWDVEMAGNGLGYPVQRVFNIGLQMSL